MNDKQTAVRPARLALDAMGGDRGLGTIVEGLRRARDDGFGMMVTVFGWKDDVQPALERYGLDDRESIEVVHTDDVVEMDAKPTEALRRGKQSSMWNAIGAVKAEKADAVVSSGNTGALMAMSVLQLRKIEGVDRPAIGALWPGLSGDSVVLDVGANVEVGAKELVQFAILVEAYYRALKGKAKPSVALLNIGEEDHKGSELIRSAATILREADEEMDFRGFVEGDDISAGTVDVVVTDGFTGNVALKTAEGTAHLLGAWVKEALTADLRSKIGAAMMMPALKELKAKMNPSRVNGGVFLGLNGLVVKSHGGADAEGVAAALRLTETLANHPFQDEVRTAVARVISRAEDKELVEDDDTAAKRAS